MASNLLKDWKKGAVGLSGEMVEYIIAAGHGHLSLEKKIINIQAK